MVTYQEFIQVGLDKCGSDQRTFSSLASLWSDEKAQLQEMTKQEVRNNLNCP